MLASFWLTPTVIIAATHIARAAQSTIFRRVGIAYHIGCLYDDSIDIAESDRVQFTFRCQDENYWSIKTPVRVVIPIICNLSLSSVFFAMLEWQANRWRIKDGRYKQERQGDSVLSPSPTFNYRIEAPKSISQNNYRPKNLLQFPYSGANEVTKGSLSRHVSCVLTPKTKTVNKPSFYKG